MADEANTKKSKEHKFFEWVGRISVVIAISLGLFQLKDRVFTPSHLLKAKLSCGINYFPDRLSQKLKECDDVVFRVQTEDAVQTALKSEYSGAMKKVIKDFLENSYNKRPLAKQLLDYHGYYEIELQNKGKSKCSNIQVYIPDAVAFQVKKNGNVIQFKENQETVKIDELLPGQNLSIMAWGNFYGFPLFSNVRGVNISSDSGAAKVQVLKDERGVPTQIFGTMYSKAGTSFLYFLFFGVGIKKGITYFINKKRRLSREVKNKANGEKLNLKQRRV